MFQMYLADLVDKNCFPSDLNFLYIFQRVVQPLQLPSWMMRNGMMMCRGCMLRALEVQCFSIFLMLFWSCLKKFFSEYVTFFSIGWSWSTLQAKRDKKVRSLIMKMLTADQTPLDACVTDLLSRQQKGSHRTVKSCHFCIEWLKVKCDSKSWTRNSNIFM